MYIEEDADTYEKVDDSEAEREEYWKGMENDKWTFLTITKAQEIS